MRGLFMKNCLNQIKQRLNEPLVFPDYYCDLSDHKDFFAVLNLSTIHHNDIVMGKNAF